MIFCYSVSLCRFLYGIQVIIIIGSNVLEEKWFIYSMTFLNYDKYYVISQIFLSLDMNGQYTRKLVNIALDKL